MHFPCPLSRRRRFLATPHLRFFVATTKKYGVHNKQNCDFWDGLFGIFGALAFGLIPSPALSVQRRITEGINVLPAFLPFPFHFVATPENSKHKRGEKENVTLAWIIHYPVLASAFWPATTTTKKMNEQKVASHPFPSLPSPSSVL